MRKDKRKAYEMERDFDLNKQCIIKIKDYFKSILNICNLGMELGWEKFDDKRMCYMDMLYFVQFYFIQLNLNLKLIQMRKHLLNIRKILNKEEREYLYNYIKDREQIYNFIWRDDFINYLLAADIGLTKIDNDLIIEDIIL